MRLVSSALHLQNNCTLWTLLKLKGIISLEGCLAISRLNGSRLKIVFKGHLVVLCTFHWVGTSFRCPRVATKLFSLTLIGLKEQIIPEGCLAIVIVLASRLKIGFKVHLIILCTFHLVQTGLECPIPAKQLYSMDFTKTKRNY